MLKVLIADDEPKFRDYLRTSINWKEYGFEICGEARNGVEALEIAMKTVPDIALLDINMPLMDGITLTEKINESCKDIALVFITGYSEFEYARKALKLGVVDYLLKPFNKEELLSTLLKIKVRLLRNLQEQKQDIDDAFFLKDRFLNMLIGDEFNTGHEETIRAFKRQGIELYSNYFMVAAVEIDNMYQLWTSASEISLWKFAVSNIISEIVKSEYTQIVFNGPDGRIVCLINFKDEKSMKNFDSNPYRKLSDEIKKYFNFTITVGMGSGVYNFKDIRKSFMESVLALQNKMLEDFGKFIEYTSIMHENRKAGFYRIDLSDQILLALRMSDMDEIRQGLKQVSEYIKENKLSIEYTYTIIMGLVSTCLSYIAEMGGNIEKVLGTDFLPYTEIKSKISLEASFNWIWEIYVKTAEAFSETRKTRASTIVENVKNYIKHNYMDNELRVEKIANDIYLDSSYIRKLFAKEAGTTIIDYISHIRMQKAKELLNSGNIKLSEISNLVGYSDAGYFSKCFKKFFNESPSEYLRLKNNSKQAK